MPKDGVSSVPATPGKSSSNDSPPKTPKSKAKPATPGSDGKKKTDPKPKANKKRKLEAIENGSTNGEGANDDEDGAKPGDKTVGNDGETGENED